MYGIKEQKQEVAKSILRRRTHAKNGPDCSQERSERMRKIPLNLFARFLYRRNRAGNRAKTVKKEQRGVGNREGRTNLKEVEMR